MENYNDWCKSNECDNYVEWSYPVYHNEEVDCFSCKLQGQSYEINEIAKECKFNIVGEKYKR